MQEIFSLAHVGAERWDAGRFFPRSSGWIPVRLRKFVLIITVLVLQGIVKSLSRSPKVEAGIGDNGSHAYEAEQCRESTPDMVIANFCTSYNIISTVLVLQAKDAQF